jgi:glyoxylase-like metal-dependent hydrolase (beta-lactamase superfamily II)
MTHTTSRKTRRVFLQQSAAAALAAVPGAAWYAAAGAEPSPPASESAAPRRLSEHLLVYPGPINVGILRDGPRALLIDCGDGRVAAALRPLGITAIEQLVFTHHHRDQACGAGPLVAAGARVGVPAAEREWFDKVADYWADPKTRWHLYRFHPHHLMLAQPLRVDAAYTDGQGFAWGPAKIQVLTTPGHTDGSVSYVIAVDGTRTVFCGDAIYDRGRVWDVYSLQKGMRKWGDYHGFLGAHEELTKSLERIWSTRPDVLVPSHGQIMTQPADAIDSLIGRLQTCYEKYAATSALRHYDKDVFGPDEGGGRLPVCPPLPVPPGLHHFGTTWVLVSQDKAALVMDCGSPRVVETLKQMLSRGEIRAVEGLWITHYHDDHVDGVPAFQEAFSCPCIADRSVADVITDPPAWRIPCISPSRARVDRATQDGESWTWHEFRLTAYNFPGQTLYHGGLLVEGDGRKMFFVGDSFTPSGMDDYCAQNRCWLGPGVGLDRCVALLDKLRPTHLFNPHVNTAFAFTPEQYAQMRANLAEREKLFGELLPWEHPNYGLDDSWVRCHPYEQRIAPGQTATFDVLVTNHSAEPREVSCRAGLSGREKLQPAGVAAPDAMTSGTIAAKSEGRVRLSVRAAADLAPGRHVVPIDVRYGARLLPQFTETVLVVDSA